MGYLSLLYWYRYDLSWSRLDDRDEIVDKYAINADVRVLTKMATGAR